MIFWVSLRLSDSFQRASQTLAVAAIAAAAAAAEAAASFWLVPSAALLAAATDLCLASEGLFLTRQ